MARVEGGQDTRGEMEENGWTPRETEKKKENGRKNRLGREIHESVAPVVLNDDAKQENE